MTRTLDRYVYRETLPLLVLGVALFTFLHVMDRIQDFTNMAVSGAPLHLVLRLWSLLLLSFLAHSIPMGVMVAVVMAAGRLATDLEVVALGALGIGPLRLFRPFLVVAVGAALAMASLTMWINPWGSAEFFRLLGELQRHAATPLIQERAFTRIGDLTVYTEEAALATSQLRGVLVADERDAGTLRIVTAPRAVLIGDAERQRTVLRLADGAVHESRPGTPGWYRVTGFTDYDTPLDVGAQVRASRADQRPEKALTAWELVSNTRALEWTRDLERAEMFILEFHRRLTYPLTPIVFAMVAFPLGARLHRGGRAAAAVGGIMLLLTYHLLQQGLGGVHALRPWGGGRWAPVICFGLLGTALLCLTGKPLPARWSRAGARLRALAPGWPSPLPSREHRQPRRADHAAAGGAAERRADDKWCRWRSTHVIDRYVLRQFALNVGCGLGVATAIFVVVDLLETIDRFLRHEPPLTAILEHYVYRVPAALHQALPIVVLVATVFLFVEVNRYHELTALKGAGMSLHRVSLPILLGAAALSAGSFAFQETVLPVLNARGDEVDRVKIKREPPRRLAVQRHVWYRGSESEFVRVDTLDGARRQMDGVTLVEIGPDFRLVKRLDAAHASWVAEGWQLDRAVVREFGPGGALRTVAATAPSRAVPLSAETISRAQTPPAAMTYRELAGQVKLLRQRGQPVGTWVLHLHAKLAFPLMTTVLALVAIACAAPWGSGGRLLGAAIAVTIAIAYWGVNSIGLSFGRAELLPPILAAWTANIVFGGVGLVLFLRVRT
jgi:LPS export ABC transporter permease LptG/LPS export ABC transporter permease LptF